MRKKYPSFDFYPGDWQKDQNLRRCSHAAKGVLIDAMCLMFESDERGFLVSNGIAWTDDEIVTALGGKSSLALKAFQELISKGVLRRDDRGAVYSKRMVEDEQKRLLFAGKQTQNGRKGGRPRNPNETQGITQTEPNSEPKKSLSSSSSISPSGLDPPNPPFEEKLQVGPIAQFSMIAIPPHMQTKRFISNWSEWCERRSIQNTPQGAVEKQLFELSGWGPEKASRALEIALKWDYKSFRDPDLKDGNPAPDPTRIHKPASEKPFGGPTL